MWTDEQLDEFEQEEHELTLEELAVLVLLLREVKGDVIKEITDFYRKYGKDGVVTYNEARKYVSAKNRKRRLAVLFSFITNKFDSVKSDFRTNLRNTLSTIVNKESEFFGVKFPKELDTFLMRTWGADDMNWSDRLDNNVNRWLFNLENDIKQAFVRRQNIDDVIELIEKRFGTMENVLERLVGSESSAMSSSARREIFKELGIERYRYYAREDERTCEICGSMHGLVFPISQYEVGVTAPLMHANCRCWTVPVQG